MATLPDSEPEDLNAYDYDDGDTFSSPTTGVTYVIDNGMALVQSAPVSSTLIGKTVMVVVYHEINPPQRPLSTFSVNIGQAFELGDIVKIDTDLGSLTMTVRSLTANHPTKLDGTSCTLNMSAGGQVSIAGLSTGDGFGITVTRPTAVQ